MDNNNENEELFSEDPEEQIEMENQFLRMKIMAETGAEIFGDHEDVPPEIMNQMLKHIEIFNANIGDAQDMSVGEALGNPVFSPSAILSDIEFEKAFDQLMDLMDEKRIRVEFLRERDDRFKYDFITGELMQQEITIIPNFDGYVNYLYEEFHPDYDWSIRKKVEEFFMAVFEKRLLQIADFLFDDSIKENEAQSILESPLLRKMPMFFELIKSFSNTSFDIQNLNFSIEEYDDEGRGSKGIGSCSGQMAYTLEFGDDIVIEKGGTFTFQLTMNWGIWEIIDFVLPGYND